MKVSRLIGFLPGCAIASDVLSVALHSRNAAPLYDVIRDYRGLDYGCRPVVLQADEGHKLHALLSLEQLDELKKALDADTIRIDVHESLSKRQESTAPIGTGDRFKGGKIAPRGLGSRKRGATADIGGILNYKEVYSAMKGLAKHYRVDLFTPPHKTFEGQTLIGGVANKAQEIKKDKQHIYFTSGIHARERGALIILSTSLATSSTPIGTALA